MSSARTVVVLLTGSPCEEYPAVSCVMSVLGPYTREEAVQVARAQPEWTAPHLMTLPREPLEPEQPGPSVNPRQEAS